VDARADRLDQAVLVEPLEPDPTGAGLGHFGSGGSVLALAEALYGKAPRAWLVTIPGTSFGFSTEMTEAGRAGVAEAAERMETLLARSGLRIERIVSSGQASPAGFWYEQADAEWVVLLSGEALLRFEDEIEARRLRAGDWLYIEPQRRHRVDWTDPAAPTVWLAVHHDAG
jgi:cupin 2 domain-containing protein